MKRLTIEIKSGHGLAAKNSGYKSKPYCIISILDKEGDRIVKDLKTVSKKSLSPVWDQVFEVTDKKIDLFAGIKITVWDHHRIRSDKFMGQVTIKINSEMLMDDPIDDYFPLSKRKNNKKETVSGSVSLVIEYEGERKKKRRRKKEKKDGIVVSDEKVRKLGLSSKWDTQDEILNTKKYVIIEEDKNEYNPSEMYSVIKEGDEKVFGRTKNSSVNIKQLQIYNHHSNTTECSKSDLKIRGGRWYFEVLLLQLGNVFLGWCTDTCSEIFDEGCFLLSSDGRKITGKNTDNVGVNWNQGDVIGCSIDLKEGEISFYTNGILIAESIFTRVFRGADTGDSFRILIGVDRNTKVNINMKDPFQYPLERFFPLHYELPNSKTSDLESLFANYEDVPEHDTEPIREISTNGTMKLSEDLGIDIQEDIAILLIAWKLNAEIVWSFSHEEWMVGWSVYGCSSLEDISGILDQWRGLIENPSEFFKFYKFIFKYLRETKRILDTEEAILVWELVIKPKGWALYEKWILFATEKLTCVNYDTWIVLTDFIESHPTDISNYETASWPTVFGDFVEWIKN